MSTSDGRRKVRCAVLDLFYVIVTIVFFYVSAALTRGCERLATEEKSD
jgi:hypothetical protein